MKYISTRGAPQEISFTDTLLMGLAADGGLFVPKHWPHVDAAQLREWVSLSYPQLAFALMRPFIDVAEIPDADLQHLLQDVYSLKHFSDPEITPVRKLHDHVHLLRLSNGPTLAFKDVAMQFLGAVFEYVLEKRHESLNILGATSGDTGSAAEYAMIGKKNINVFMLSPYQRMSPFQQAQMYSLNEANIFNLAIRGVFDDCQDLVKALNQDAEFKKQHHIGAVNSINWARILAQIVYYFKAWLTLDLKDGELIDFCVPSGNFGNILAGYYAKKMGLPIRHLIVATNENDVLYEFFKQDVYQVRSSNAIHATSSPSMDIGKASNLERYIFDIAQGNSDVMRIFATAVEQKIAFDVHKLGLKEAITASGFLAGRSSHADRIATIRDLYQNHGILIDPHTADGVHVARKLGSGFTEKCPLMCLETALPAKFAATIREALNIEAPRPEHYAKLEERPQHFTVINNNVEELKTFIRQALHV